MCGSACSLSYFTRVYSTAPLRRVDDQLSDSGMLTPGTPLVPALKKQKAFQILLLNSMVMCSQEKSFCGVIFEVKCKDSYKR